MPDFRRSRPCARVVALCPALALVALTACSSAPSPGDRAAKVSDATHSARQRGYVPDARLGLAQARERWLVGQVALDVALTAPANAGSYPLVVYYPGLGEPADAAPAWRTAWAEAGYVVVSVQPVDLGPELWGSPAARAGDFRGIARQQFSRRSLAERGNLLKASFAELLRRRDAGTSPLLQRADVSRVAVAGFDLGAQTALVAAGATSEGAPSDIVPPERLRAVIALSPYADPARAGFEQEFGSVRTPVLTVTGLNDLDAYGFVTSASARRIPYQYMPADGKLLVVVYAVSHSLLSGRSQPSGERISRPGSGRRADEAGAVPDTAGRGRVNRDTPMAGGGDSDTSYLLDVAPATWGAQLGTVESVTLAYLDAKVKGDDLAAEWLAKDLVRWLGDSGEVRAK